MNQVATKIQNWLWRLSCSGWLAGLSTMVLLTGCAYHLGPSNGLAPGEQSVEVFPFANQTLEPRLTDAVTTQLRKEITREGTYRLASRADADILLTGSIIEYDRHELTFSPKDTLTVRDYRVRLVAQVTVTDRSSGRKILDQRVTGHTIIRVGDDLVSSERQALPLLSADLARNVVGLLADGAW
jgi:hypothetical protein